MLHFLLKLVTLPCPLANQFLYLKEEINEIDGFAISFNFDVKFKGSSTFLWNRSKSQEIIPTNKIGASAQ